jgi:CRP-like cAMP-binding protein
MPSIPPTVTEPRNRLLARLPEPEYRRLTPLLHPVTLAYDQVLYQADGPIDSAYFPTGTVLSAMTVMRDGNAIDVASVGDEGLVGLYGLNGRTSPHRVVTQVGGEALRMESRALEREAAKEGPMRDLLSAYQAAFVAQLSQAVACNGLHRVQQRCCRWLLMARDRVGSDDIELTHDYLAAMLGARRASVTEALRPLQAEGLVRSHRGCITILDGAGLEARLCECYAIVKGRYDRLLGES